MVRVAIGVATIVTIRVAVAVAMRVTIGVARPLASHLASLAQSPVALFFTVAVLLTQIACLREQLRRSRRPLGCMLSRVLREIGREIASSDLRICERA